MDRLSRMALAAGKNFNDELTLILNHAESSLGLLGAAHPASAGLVELEHAARRCADIARSLLLLTLRARDNAGRGRVRADHADPGDRELLR